MKDLRALHDDPGIFSAVCLLRDHLPKSRGTEFRTTNPRSV